MTKKLTEREELGVEILEDLTAIFKMLNSMGINQDSYIFRLSEKLPLKIKDLVYKK